MKKTALFASIALFSAASGQASTAIQGSDTLAGVITDAIISGGLDTDLTYIGGGSSKGETALISGTQALAPMSRAFKDAARGEAAKKNISVTEHVIGLDAVSLYVNETNAISSLSLEQIKGIYSCAITNWSDLGGTNGAIAVYARDEFSGTTDTFKKLVGIAEFGSCVTAVTETSEIALRTSKDPLAVGFSGLSGKREKNRVVPLAATTGAQASLPTEANVRSKKYPLARELYVYEAGGALVPSAAENELIDLLLDPSFINPILRDNDFITLK
jgi:phosphate transport system substrate-binding protein